MTLPENVVYLAGVARSGTSWLGQVFNSAPEVAFRFQPFFAYEFKGRVNEDSTREEYEALLADMVEVATPFLTQSERQASGEYPTFAKDPRPRALVFKENRYQSLIAPMLRRVPALRGVGLVRHPCAVLNSWRKHPKEFPPGSDIRAEWRFGNCKNKGNEDYFGYYKWKEVANLYLDLRDQNPSRFRCVRYEDLVRSPRDEIPKLFAFAGVAYGEQTRRFLEESGQSRSESYYGVYKDRSVADQWRTELDPSIVAEVLADLRGTRLEGFAE